MAEGLDGDNFADFFRAVHGYEPFPWQVDLTREVLERRRWPAQVDVPTGLGKTSLLDIAVFVLAATSAETGAERLGRRRCLLVVDRRIVVDQAFDHARTIASALQHPQPRILVQVAQALRSLTSDPDPGSDVLTVTRMRGGTSWSSAWVERPDQPTLVLATVDQVGSRFLFRGYGTSPRRAPIDAALVGTDSLLLVDEAHLARALVTTVHAAQACDRLELPLPALDVVQLSATVGDEDEGHGWRYELDVPAHHESDEAWRRLTAAKRLTCQTSAKNTIVRTLVDATVAELTRLSGDTQRSGEPAVLVVCNTVTRARAVHEALARRLAGTRTPVAFDTTLLMGRSRPIDRAVVRSTDESEPSETLVERVECRFGAQRQARPLAAVLVATQTVEVGVNLDCDALVTESASWDALVQRLGRLNRLGRFTERFPGSSAALAVVVDDGQRDGPVYGRSRDVTWTALVDATTDGGIDVSPLGCRSLSNGLLRDPDAALRAAQAPVLLAPTLDAWTQTGPVPQPDPPIQPFLHGFDSGSANVQVAWRSGLVTPDPFDDDVLESAQLCGLLLDAVPLRAAEVVEVPFAAVRSWMLGLTSPPVSDVESVDQEGPNPKQEHHPFEVLAWRSVPDNRLRSGAAGGWQWIDGQRLRPGDRIVVPCERGGLDRYGWHPESEVRVIDVAESASFLEGRHATPGLLRVDSGLGGRLGIDTVLPEELTAMLRLLQEFRDEPAEVDEVGTTLLTRLCDSLPAEPPAGAGWTKQSWSRLGDWLRGGSPRLTPVTTAPADLNDPAPIAWLLTGYTPHQDELHAPIVVGTAPDDDEVAKSSVGLVPVLLESHLQAVGARAAQISGALGLPDELSKAVVDAARWHDHGKIEPRFQVMLHGGDPGLAELNPAPLAKSGMDEHDRLAFRRATALSRLPRGARHEAWSAALVADHFAALRAEGRPYPGDEDLVVHLVASHHGYARPWLPLVQDREPRPVTSEVDGLTVTVSSDRTVMLDHPARFARLNRRYGRWGLALLETVVRSADQTVSGEGS